MKYGEINQLYFDWMSSLAIPDNRKRRRYSKLLECLNSLSFNFTIPLDKNRKVDGLTLRYRFGFEKGFSNLFIQENLDNNECSMLEMMVALALRAEEHIMYDPDIGDRLHAWFAEMLNSLQLYEMTNDNFDPRFVEYRIDILLNHQYEPNGYGGLFTHNQPRTDMRSVDIWYQMCWYLDAILKE